MTDFTLTFFACLFPLVRSDERQTLAAEEITFHARGI